MSEPTVLRTARLDTAGNYRGLVQVIAGGQVVHSKLLPGRPDQRAAEKDAANYEPPWDEILADANGLIDPAADDTAPTPAPPTPPDPEVPADADPKEATAARVKAAFTYHDDAEQTLQHARREREIACLEASQAGHTYAQIADLVGTSHQTISQLARRERERREKGGDEAAEE